MISSFLFAVLCISCNERKLVSLHAENEVLRNELKLARTLATAFRQVDITLDSIEKCIDDTPTLRINAGYGEFSTRLLRVHRYVRASRAELALTTSEADILRHQAKAYRMLAEALKSEVGLRIREAADLEASMGKYEEENLHLNQSLSVQLAARIDLEDRVKEKDAELKLLRASLAAAEANSRIAEAEVYYRMAVDLEADANRIRLDRARREETFREAVELYRKALRLGKPEAANQILELESTFTSARRHQLRPGAGPH